MHTHGSFVWIDLSTFQLAEAKAFYRAALRWEFADQGGYLNAYNSSKEACAGIYEMPSFFQKINMPSFWMTYIAVDNIKATVAKARELGAKVELEESNALGEIALIRDPLGAGFTCYQGSQGSALETDQQNGRWVGSELFISDFAQISTFYTELFNWQLTPDHSGKRYSIRTKDSGLMGAINVTSTAEKGDKEYWAVLFQVEDVKRCAERIRAAGGRIVDQQNGRAYVYDNQDAYFIIQNGAYKVSRQTDEISSSLPLKWRSILALLLLYIAIFFELNWAWALLFLIWVIPDLKRGQTHFVEPLSRKADPLLYWLVMGTWVGLLIWMLFGSIL